MRFEDCEMMILLGAFSPWNAITIAFRVRIAYASRTFKRIDPCFKDVQVWAVTTSNDEAYCDMQNI